MNTYGPTATFAGVLVLRTLYDLPVVCAGGPQGVAEASSLVGMY